MTTQLFKLGRMLEDGVEVPYSYPNVWARESTTSVPRLAIAPRSNHIELLQALAACLQEPFLVLYVLVVPRGEGEAGRYQSEYSFTHVQLRDFLASYADFFDHDGRLNLWIRSTPDNGLLVYDRHNIIYAYGPLDQFARILNGAGLTETKQVRFPAEAHVHHYHDHFDQDATRILVEQSWSLSPLRPGDENPD